MTEADDDFELIRGSGNVFRDLGLPNPDIEQAKASLCAAIIRAQEEQGLNNLAAARKAGIDVGDVSRIRNCDLDRFTIDRLMRIVHRLDPEVRMVLTEERGAEAVHG